MIVMSKYKSKSSYKTLSDYTVIDLETTDFRVHSCEIIEVAAVRVREGEVAETFSQLIQPRYVIPELIEEITGITNEMVRDEPPVEEVLPEYMKFIGDDVVVGHNIASFDSNVLSDFCERVLGRTFSNEMVDTLHFSKKCAITPENFKLTTIAGILGITYDAHRALNDCIANYQVYEKLKPLFDENIVKERTNHSKQPRQLTETTIALSKLADLCRSITSDLTDEKIFELYVWMKDNLHLAGNYPFDAIFSKIGEILDDGIITEEERESLISLLQIHADPVSNQSDDLDDDLAGSTVCLSGDFQMASKAIVTATLEHRGVKVSNAITSKVDYLIVGGKGSAAWSCGNYGSKVKKALELQEKGKNIKIIREEVLVKWLNTMK